MARQGLCRTHLGGVDATLVHLWRGVHKACQRLAPAGKGVSAVAGGVPRLDRVLTGGAPAVPLLGELSVRGQKGSNAREQAACEAQYSHYNAIAAAELLTGCMLQCSIDVPTHIATVLVISTYIAS